MSTMTAAPTKHRVHLTADRSFRGADQYKLGYYDVIVIHGRRFGLCYVPNGPDETAALIALPTVISAHPEGPKGKTYVVAFGDHLELLGRIYRVEADARIGYQPNELPTLVRMPELEPPLVGQGATLYYPQDRYPYVITRVSESRKTFWCVPLVCVDKSTGHEADRHMGPWPIWDHEYTDAELVEFKREAPERMVRLTKNGWASRGTPIEPGYARYYRNFAD